MTARARLEQRRILTERITDARKRWVLAGVKAQRNLRSGWHRVQFASAEREYVAAVRAFNQFLADNPPRKRRCDAKRRVPATL